MPASSIRAACSSWSARVISREADTSEAYDEAIWPGYRESIARIRDNLLDPARAAWFELQLDGSRVGG